MNDLLPAGPKKRLGVFKFASCDGCQLSLLSCEDELLELTEKIEIAHFLEASSRIQPGPYDIALVEGSITTAGDIERIREIRRQSKFLVAIGACATAGGIQALPQRGRSPRIHFRRIRLARVHRHAVIQHIHRRSRRGGLRAQRVPHRPTATAGCPPSPHRRSPTSHSSTQRLRGVQTRGHDLPGGQPGHAVPRSHHTSRVRRDLSDVRPRLLRLLRTRRAGQLSRPVGALFVGRSIQNAVDSCPSKHECGRASLSDRRRTSARKRKSRSDQSLACQNGLRDVVAAD